jgi:hypothetical protein
LVYWPWIERELDTVSHTWYGHWTKESLRDLALCGQFQVWGFGPPNQIRIVVFTQLIHYPAGIVLQGFLSFGNSLDLALPIMEATFERFALETGCWRCEIVGRKSWGRKIGNLRLDYSVFSRQVEQQGVH